jgi:hypothetical protein
MQDLRVPLGTSIYRLRIQLSGADRRDIVYSTTIKAFTFACREPDLASVSRCRHCYYAESFIVMKEDREGYLADYSHAKSGTR